MGILRDAFRVVIGVGLAKGAYDASTGKETTHANIVKLIVSWFIVWFAFIIVGSFIAWFIAWILGDL